MPNIIEEMFQSFDEMTIEEIVNMKDQYFQQHGYSDVVNKLVFDYLVERTQIKEVYKCQNSQ